MKFTIPTIPGMLAYPDLQQEYVNAYRAAAGKCGGANCFTQAVIQKYTNKLRQRKSTKARP